MCVSNNDEYEMIADEIDALRDKKADILSKGAAQDALMKRIEEMREFIESQTSRITEFDEQMVRRLIEKITVFSDHLEFTFKSGMTIKLKR